MSQVLIKIGGYNYSVACTDGEEAHLQNMGELINAKADEAHQALGSLNEVRQLLYASLLLADELTEVRLASPARGAGAATATTEAPIPDAGFAEALTQLAERIERIASSLELSAE